MGSLLEPLLKKVTPVVGSRMLCEKPQREGALDSPKMNQNNINASKVQGLTC
jgi:hypothetical protein